MTSVRSLLVDPDIPGFITASRDACAGLGCAGSILLRVVGSGCCRLLISRHSSLRWKRFSTAEWLIIQFLFVSL
jgi:hypothetical protein